MAYATLGRGRPLVLLHGFTGSGRTWRAFFERWADERRLIAFDALGHGDSPAPLDPWLYRQDVAAEDLLATMSRLGWERFDLMGYSMGGRLALQVARRAPQRVRSLVLESTSPGLGVEHERQSRRAADEALAERIERIGVASFAREWAALPLFAGLQRLEMATQKELEQVRASNRKRGLAHSLRGAGVAVLPSVEGDLSGLRMPTLLVVGSEDGKYCKLAAGMAQRMPCAQVIKVHSAGHTVHLEQPAAYAAAVESFWSSL